jgi:hypothetical protein
MMLTAKQLTPQEAQEYGMYIEDYILKPVTHSELYSAIEGVINRRRQIAEDMTKAKEGGFDDALINEYGRLVKSTEITKRLLKLLSSTYDLSDPSMKFSDDINIAIKSMETNMKFQEQRLIQIREIFQEPPEPSLLLPSLPGFSHSMKYEYDLTSSPMFDLVCIGCGATYRSDAVIYTCSTCGHLLEVRYDLANINITRKDWLSRPISVWRYLNCFPLPVNRSPCRKEEPPCTT